MKTLITGKSTLFSALAMLLPCDTCRIEDVLEGKIDLSQYGAFINYAHVGFKQVELLLRNKPVVGEIEPLCQ